MLTDEQLEDLATLHLAPQIDAGEGPDLLPLPRAIAAAECEVVAIPDELMANYEIGFVQVLASVVGPIVVWCLPFDLGPLPQETRHLTWTEVPGSRQLLWSHPSIQVGVESPPAL